MTPKKIHFVLLQDGGGRYEVPLVYYIAMKSAAVVNSGYEVFLHTNVEPVGLLWEDLKSRVSVESCVAPEEIYGVAIERIHHKVDVIRLQTLIKHGGIYLDLDTICLKPFDSLLKDIPVIGREAPNALCNAVIIAPAGCEFLFKWIDGYQGFHNAQWNEFSVLLPMKLANEYPNLIFIEPEASFFVPDYHDEGLRDLFERNKSFPDAYIYHLWGYASKRYIDAVTIDDILGRDTTYNVAARSILTAGGTVDALRRSRASVVAKPEVFQGIYRDGVWGKGSGNGSNPAATTTYRALVEEFILLNGIQSVVDIGCGDWQSSRYMNFGGASYAGFDVVPEVIEENRAHYSAPGVTFDVMPDDPQLLPKADLLIVKDVLQHLPDPQIHAFRDLVLPRYRYCLITNSWRAINYPHNVGISAGEFRSLDLQNAPFFFNGAYVHEMWNQWERIRTLLVVNDLRAAPS